MRITVDIETVPGQQPGLLERIKETIKPPATYKKPESIAEWMQNNASTEAELAWRKTALDGAVGQICVIGYAIEDEEPVALYSEDYAGGDADLLKAFFESINKLRADGKPVRPYFIGHNITGFDLPFIFHRAVINNIPLPDGFPIHPKPWGNECFDVMNYWAGPRNYISLDNLCSALGIEGKGSIDGSLVWDYVRAGRISEIAEYCKHDVSITRAAFNRLTFKGAIADRAPESTYQEAS